ncbi:uncharacterized protein LOC144736328 isoform X1 [Lampetra planeri]
MEQGAGLDSFFDSDGARESPSPPARCAVRGLRAPLATTTTTNAHTRRLEMPANPLDKGEGKRSPPTHSDDDCSSSSSGSFSSSSSSFNSYGRSPRARSPGRKSVTTPPLLSDDSDSDLTSSAACRKGPNCRAKLEMKIPTGTPRAGDDECYSDDFDDCLEEARKRLRRLRAESVAHCGECLGGAAPARDGACGSESGGSVTDVTPLSSAGSSPRDARRRHDRRPPPRQENLNFRLRGRERPLAAREDPATPAGAGKREGDSGEEEFDDLLRSVLSERRGRAPGAVAAASAGSRRTSAGRRNFSFNNAECERIERENRRLLRELCHKSTAPGPAGGGVRGGGGVGRGGRDCAGRPCREAAPAPVLGARASPSAKNRQREHMRIERANYALLKRLEAAKVSPGLRRAEQLRDHARLTGQPLPPLSSSRPASHRSKSQGRATEGSTRASSSFGSRGDRVHGLQPRSLLSARPAWDPRCAW